MKTQSPSISSIELMILALLARDSLHGYALITALHQQSKGIFDLAEGTVYPTLYRLENDGLISSKSVVVQSRRRRVYYLSSSGRRAFVHARRQWQREQRGMRHILRHAYGS